MKSPRNMVLLAILFAFCIGCVGRLHEEKAEGDSGNSLGSVGLLYWPSNCNLLIGHVNTKATEWNRSFAYFLP